jgi:hypothetical protein
MVRTMMIIGISINKNFRFFLVLVGLLTPVSRPAAESVEAKVPSYPDSHVEIKRLFAAVGLKPHFAEQHEGGTGVIAAV